MTASRVDADEVFTAVEFSAGFSHGDYHRWLPSIAAKLSNYDEDGEPELVATAVFYKAELESAARNGYLPGYLLDTESSTAPYIDLFCETDDGSSFIDEVEDAVGFLPGGRDLLIADRIEILPRYRGHGLAERLIDDASQMFGGFAELIVLKPFPLQFEYHQKERNISAWEERIDAAGFQADEPFAQKKLIGHYEKMGFKKIENTELMARAR